MKLGTYFFKTISKIKKCLQTDIHCLKTERSKHIQRLELAVLLLLTVWSCSWESKGAKMRYVQATLTFTCRH